MFSGQGVRADIRSDSELAQKSCLRVQLAYLLSEYVGESEGLSKKGPEYKPRYFSKEERKKYLVTIQSDGKFVDTSGRGVSTEDSRTESSNGKGRAIFVMSENLELFMHTKQEEGKIHHSSLIAGEPAAAAGEMVIWGGYLRVISDRSGHYSPHPEQMLALLKYLKDKGVDLTNVTVEFRSDKLTDEIREKINELGVQPKNIKQLSNSKGLSPRLQEMLRRRGITD